MVEEEVVFGSGMEILAEEVVLMVALKILAEDVIIVVAEEIWVVEANLVKKLDTRTRWPKLYGKTGQFAYVAYALEWQVS